MYEGICDAIHRELSQLDEKMADGSTMNGQELDHIDKMVHALKSLAAYEAMQGYGNYSNYDGGSYARGRSRTTGRYVSRDGGYDGGRRY